MTIFGKQLSRTILLLSGTVLCVVLMFGAARSTIAAATWDLANGSTCGTYKAPPAGGPDDPGVNPPFVTTGQVNPRCISAAGVPANAVCHFENPQDCYLASPTPPFALASDKICQNSGGNRVCLTNPDCPGPTGPCVPNPQGWHVQVFWYTTSHLADTVLRLWEDDGTGKWKCFYTPGSQDPDCDAGLPIPYLGVSTVFGNQISPTVYEHISSYYPVTPNKKFYYSIQSLSCRRSEAIAGFCTAPGHSYYHYCTLDIDHQCNQPSDCSDIGLGTCNTGHVPEMRSEIRTFVSSYEDYTLDVTPPAVTKVVTGQTSNAYTVTMTPSGTISGGIALDVVWDSPAPAGTTIQWAGGSNVITVAGPGVPVTKTFTIQTNSSSTTAGVYSFHIHGSHPTAGDRYTLAPDPSLTVQDFTLGAPSVNPIDMNPTASRSVTMNLGWLPAVDPLTQPVTFTTTVYPWLTTSFAPSPIANPFPAVTATLQTNNAPPGNYPITFTATANPSGLVRQVSATIHINMPPDFDITVAPLGPVINQGAAQTYTVTINAYNGFNSPVTLSVTGLDATMSGSFGSNPLAIAGPTTTTQLTVTTQTPLTPCGGSPYPLTVTGTSAALTHNFGVKLTVNCILVPDFSLSAIPISVTVIQGNPALFSITAASRDGYSGTVNFSCITMSNCAFDSGVPTANVTPASPGVISLSVDTTALTVGAHIFHVQGVDGPLSHVIELTINVDPIPTPPDFSFDVTPATLTINEGSSGDYTVQVNAVGTFNQPLTISWNTTPGFPGSLTITPASGFSMNPGTRTLTVQANAGSAGTYTLDFTAATAGFPSKQRLGIQLTVNGPPSSCPGGCPANNTCTPAGCQLDPAANGQCNESLCYDSNGQFREPASPGCWKSWQRCSNFNILKVQKDRQCQQWLDCVSTISAVNTATGKEQNQCTVLGLCDQLGPDGQCIHHLSPSASLANMSFVSPDDVQGANSKIRWYSGYSSGFHFSDLKQGAITGSQIAATYPPKDIRETGLSGATRNLVQNGEFETLTCLGGKRDGLACITTSDCRVDQGVCADTQSPDPVTSSSSLPCTTDADCKLNTNGLVYCRYVSSWGGDVDCRNPVDSKWLGVTPPSSSAVDSYEEAGFGGKTTANYSEDKRKGVRTSTTGDELVQWHTWEDEENLEDQTQKLQGEASPRYPDYSPFKHLKEGNNIMKVVLQPNAKQFSGVGVRVATVDQPLAVGDATSYSLSFRFKYGENEGTPLTIKAQFGFNYISGSAGGYEKTENSFLDFKDQQGNAEIRDAGTEWKTYVFGPMPITAAVSYDRSKAVFLNFVSTAAGTATPTTFYLDDVSLKPVLNTGDPDAGRSFTKLPRSCRLYPKGDAPGCEYRDVNGTNYKGWRGYCLDRDPKNESLCLTWWPLDVLGGESALGSVQPAAYTGRYPLYQCVEANGGRLVLDETTPSLSYPSDGSAQNILDLSGQNVHWRDIERIDIYADMASTFRNDASFARCSQYKLCDGAAIHQSIDVSTCSCSEYVLSDAIQRTSFYWRVRLDTINRVAGDNGLRMIQMRNGQPPGGPDAPWANIWGGACSGSHNDQYIALRLGFNNLANPNADNAIVSSFDYFVCNDEDSDGGGRIQFRVVIRLKQVCDYLVQTVSEQGTDPKEKVWTTRVKTASQYTVPDYTITAGNPVLNPNTRYRTDVAPYGSINGLTNDTPESWAPWSNNNNPNDGNISSAPQGFILRESTGGRDARAGTPMSYHRALPANNYGLCQSGVCSTNSSVTCASNNDCTVVAAKYCTLPQYEVHPAGSSTVGPYSLGFQSVALRNPCSTNRDIQMCEKAGGSCLGSPIGRCSLNNSISCGSNADCKSDAQGAINASTATCAGYRCSFPPGITAVLSCATDDDCKNVPAVKAFDYGTCTAPAVSSAAQHVTTQAYLGPLYDGIWAPRDRLSRLFAAVYGCWEYSASLVNGFSGGQQLEYRYNTNCHNVPGLGTWDNSQNWDIYSPAVGDGVGPHPAHQCPGNVRPTQPDGSPKYDKEYCWVRPTISDVTIGGAVSGDVSITDRERQTVTALFHVSTDKDQKPVQSYRVLWSQTNAAAPTPVQCFNYTTADSRFAGFEDWAPITSPSKIDPRINYPAAGTYHPSICVQDHWGVVSVFQFPGTINVQ